MSFFVEKRDGRKESVHFDKITMRIEKLAYGLARNVRFIYPRVLIPIDGWFRVGVPHQLPSFSFIFRSCTHLSSFFFDLQHVDPVVISQKVIQGVYPGVTTVELDEYVLL